VKSVLWISLLPVAHILQKHARLAYCSFAQNPLYIFVLSKDSIIQDEPVRHRQIRLGITGAPAEVATAAAHSRATRRRGRRRTAPARHDEETQAPPRKPPRPNDELPLLDFHREIQGHPGLLACSGHVQGRTAQVKSPSRNDFMRCVASKS
jgi:hypothetical protein